MEVKGNVISVLPEVSGTSKAGKAWSKRDFVIETEGQYPKKICVTLFGDKVAKCPNVGANVTVSIDIESHEYQGKWFTQVNAWDVKTDSTAAANPTLAASPAPAAANDNFPF